MTRRYSRRQPQDIISLEPIGLEPQYTVLSCIVLQLLATLYFFNTDLILTYAATMAAWGVIAARYWSERFPYITAFDPFPLVSTAALLCLYNLHASAPPIAIVWAYLLLICPSCSAYMISGMTGELAVFKDMRSLSMLFAMGTVVLTISFY